MSTPVPPHPSLRAESLSINDQEYLEMTGLNVMLAHDFYPEVTPGRRGGDLERPADRNQRRPSVDPTPGQWQPTPAVGRRQVDRATQEISVRMAYPDERQDRKGLNPIGYPD